MPTTNEILEGLTAIANEAVIVAVLWHLAIAAVMIAIAKGWRPSRRGATALFATPLATVAIAALLYGNVFNGLVFVAGAVVMTFLAGRSRDTPVEPGPAWAIALGGAMIAFAWAYPHFLQGAAWPSYLYAAPVGLVPCPSLALVIGFALVGGGVDRRVAGVLSALGLFYGAFGMARLGVVLDVGLVAGALGLSAFAIQTSRWVPGPSSPLRTARM